MVPWWSRYNSPRCLTQVATDGNPQEIWTDLWPLKSWEDWVDISGQRWQSRQEILPRIQPILFNLFQSLCWIKWPQLVLSICQLPVAHVFQGWIPQHLHISWSISHCFPVSSNCGLHGSENMLPLNPVHCHPTWKMWLKQIKTIINHPPNHHFYRWYKPFPNGWFMALF